MQVRLKYCEMCAGNGDAARALAAELKQKMGLDVELIDVGKGAFELSVEGRVIFSALQLNRFPVPNEIIKLLRSGKV
jgi:selT/selW/selH-like putative selenoprotein